MGSTEAQPVMSDRYHKHSGYNQKRMDIMRGYADKALHTDGRAKLPTAIDPKEIVDTVAMRVAVPLASGHLHTAQRQLAELWEQLHGNLGRDPLEDLTEVWLEGSQADKVSQHLDAVGIITMRDLIHKDEATLRRIPQIGDNAIDMIRRAVEKFNEVTSATRHALVD